MSTMDSPSVLIKSYSSDRCDIWLESGVTEWESAGVVCVELGVDVPPSSGSKPCVVVSFVLSSGAESCLASTP